MKTSRRNFLKGAGILSAAALIPSLRHGFVSTVAAASTEPVNYIDGYLSAMEIPFAAPVNLYFERIIGANPVGLVLYDLTNERMITALAPEILLPNASAFKGPMLMYFIDMIDPAVWNSVPVEYWNAVAKSEVPEEYQDTWTEHFYILRSLHQALVLSDNHTTGTVLSYIAKKLGKTNIIEPFNDWARERVGISQLSGLSSWDLGVDEGLAFTDERFTDRKTSISSQLVSFDNMMTPRDLGLFYIWMLTTFNEDQQRVCKSLLSTIHNNRGANLERLALGLDAIPYSKNGSLETEQGYVVTDAGLIDMPDNHQYLLVLMSINAPTIIPTVFEELNATLRGKYNEDIQSQWAANVVGDDELNAMYSQQVRAAYTEQSDAVTGDYRYGFVLPHNINIYSAPDESKQLHNPIIKTTRFAVHLLMQGALVRYVEVNREWLELMPDDAFDNVRSRLGLRIFVKRGDIWNISLKYAEPITNLVNPNSPHTDKYVVISLQARELMAFEGDQPVLKVPIVLNEDATPRGAQVITSKWFARSMQPWAPGVPFTSFFGAEGFAIHGSPWQRWSSTVNQNTIHNRLSAGCVNIPDWMITVGDYTRPADELLFRWIGGMENPRQGVFEYPSTDHPALRIYNVDYPHNLRTYIRPEGMVNTGISWDDVITMMEETPLQAPDSFYV